MHRKGIQGGGAGTGLAMTLSVLLCCGTVHAHWRDVPDVQILVNQCAYPTDAPKYFIIQSKKEITNEKPEFQLLDADGNVAFTGAMQPVVRAKWRDENRPWYRVGDFTEFKKPGTVRVRVEVLGKQLVSYPFEIGDHALMRKTAGLAEECYYIARCGVENYAHKACHLDDAVTADGRRIEVTGGWHDAGNYPKLHVAIPYGVYAWARFAESGANKHFVRLRKEDPLPLEEAIFGAAYLRKIMDPESGRLRGMVDATGARLKELQEEAKRAGDNRTLGPAGYPPNVETDNKPDTGDERQIVFRGLPKYPPVVIYRKAGSVKVPTEKDTEGHKYRPLLAVVAGDDNAQACFVPAAGRGTLPVKEGTHVYCDRTYRLTAFPKDLESGLCVPVFVMLGAQGAGGGVGFDLTAPATVYVAVDKRNPGVPRWLEADGFRKTGSKVAMTKPGRKMRWHKEAPLVIYSYDVYAKPCAAGTVRLGGAADSDTSPGKARHYPVFVKAAGTNAAASGLVSSVRHHLCPEPLRRGGRCTTDLMPEYAVVPKEMKGAMAFRQHRKMPAGYAFRVETAPEATVYLVADPANTKIRDILKNAGCERTIAGLKIWTHYFTGSSAWHWGYTRANAYTVAGFATLYRLTKEKRYLEDAKRLWKTVTNDPTDIISDACILQADVEMYRSERNDRYLKDAARRLATVVNAQNRHGHWLGVPGADNAGGHYSRPPAKDCCAGLTDYLLVAPDTPEAKNAEACLRKYFEHCKRDSLNIFGIRQSDRKGILSQASSPGVAGQARILFHMAKAFDKRDPELAAEARKMAFASAYWVLGMNPYGYCLLSQAGSKHVERYLSWYYPDEFPGSMGAGIHPEGKDTDVPYLDIRKRSKYRGRGDGQTAEPGPWKTGHWVFMLSDRRG